MKTLVYRWVPEPSLQGIADRRCARKGHRWRYRNANRRDCTRCTRREHWSNRR